jgi:maltose phosphorylase
MDKVKRGKDMSSQIISADPWRIIEKWVHPEFNEETESIFSLGNEYMGTRGNFEEGFSAPTLEGCYIGGIYVKERQSYVWKRKGFPDFANYLINTVNWLRIHITVDGESFSMSDSDVSNYSRILDMRQGVLQSSY